MVKPLVSVYIPTHNRPQLLARAVASVVAQDYRPLEVIVVDDGSTPDNQQQNLKICADYAEVTLLQLPQSGGACAARNMAIAAAKGEFITGLDDDDEFMEGRITNFVLSWPQKKAISLLCTGYHFILPGGKKLVSGKRSMLITEQRIKHINDIGNQIFTKTAYLKEIGGFDAGLVACQDYDVWIRLILQFGNALRLPMQNYTVHQEHDSPRISISNRRLKGHQQLIEKFRYGLTPAQLRSQYFFCALYSGESNLYLLFKLAGYRHALLLLKMLLVRALSKH